MPYVSSAQEKYFNANRAKLEAQGVNVNEWNKSSKGLKLPEHVKKHTGKGGPSSTKMDILKKILGREAVKPGAEGIFNSQKANSANPLGRKLKNYKGSVI